MINLGSKSFLLILTVAPLYFCKACFTQGGFFVLQTQKNKSNHSLEQFPFTVCYVKLIGNGLQHQWTQNTRPTKLKTLPLIKHFLQPFCCFSSPSCISFFSSCLFLIQRCSQMEGNSDDADKARSSKVNNIHWKLNQALILNRHFDKSHVIQDTGRRAHGENSIAPSVLPKEIDQNIN